jgi:hypothetical protein
MLQTKNKDKVLGRNTSGVAVAAPLSLGRARMVLGVVAAAVAAVTLSVATAQATTGHAVTGTFGTPFSTDPGGFNCCGSPAGVAVRQSTGDVFATDPSHADSGGAARVEQFDGSGAFQAEFPIDPAFYSSPQAIAQAIAIDPNGSGALYVGATDNATSQGTVLKYALDGTFQYALVPDAGTTLNPGAVAVDPASGDVYVGGGDGGGAPIVEVFDNAGAFQNSFDGAANGNDGPLGGVGSIAVDGSSRVYVTDTGKNRVDRFSSAGAFQATVASGGTLADGSPFVTFGALAADPVSDEIYVVENGNRVESFTAGGAAHQDVFSAGANVTGVAVNAGSDTLFLADQGQTQGLIAAPFVGSTVTTLGSTGVDATSATLEGTIDSGGIDTNYFFEYGTDANYGTSTNGGPAGSGNGAVPVADLASGLLPNTKYFFRLVGANADGSGAIFGETRTFTTATAPPIVGDASASDIKPDGATINGTINPQGSSTTYAVEYGTTLSYGASEPGASPLEGQGDQPAPLVLTGLAPGTEYHYRLVADNNTGGVQTGVDHTFTTAPAAPAGALAVTAVTANLTGTVNPQGQPAQYQFEYGETTSYGTMTPKRSAGSGSGDTTVGTLVGGLKPSTTYHVRVIAIDTATNVTTTGVDGTFTTNPAALVTTGAVSGVATTQATFSGDADTHGLGGTYRFYVESSTSTYMSSTAPATIAAAGHVTGALTDLLPGETYTVRLAVESSGYTAVGDAVTFTTAPLAPVSPPAPPTTVENPYGCVRPVLNAYNKHPKPGDTITVTGTDLGVAGVVALGGATIRPSSWSATSFAFVVPDDAKGSLPLTINCGKASNTVAVQMFQAPSNTFTTKKKVKGSTATLTLKVPGPGDVTVRGAGVKTAKRHVGKAGTYTVRATLSASGKKSLRRHGRLARTLRVSFRPNGGTVATKSATVTFRR